MRLDYGNSTLMVQSHPTGRTHAVKINKSISLDVPLSTGVPKGFVLGPLIFLVYLQILRVINKYAISRHGFADGTQIYSRRSVKKTQPFLTFKSTLWKLHSKCLILDDCEQTQTERRKNEVIVTACSNQQCRLKDISI